MELIKISENSGRKVVSAKELYEFIGYDKSNWSKWFPKNITENQFAIENVDYQTFVLITNGNETKDFIISVDFAKRLSMMARTKKGEQARLYFIECEKQINKPLSQIEIILQSAQILTDIERNQKALENRIEAIEKRPQINAPIEHFSIMGYCHNIGKQISIGEAKSLSIKCRKICNELGLVIGKVSDPRFGSVNTYPLNVLKEVIK